MKASHKIAVNSIYALLLGIGLFATLYGYFSLLHYPHIAAIIGMAFVQALLFGFVLLGLHGRARGIVLGALFCIWLAAGFVLRAILIEGAEAFVGYVIPELYRITPYEFQAPPTPTQQQEWACMLFCGWALCPWVAGLVAAVMLRKSSVLSMLLTVPVFTFSYMLAGIPASPVVALQFIFWLTLMVAPRRGVKGPAQVLVPLLAVLLSGTLFATMLNVRPREDFTAPLSIRAVRDDIIDLALWFEYGEGLQGLRGIAGFGGGAPLASSDTTARLSGTGALRFADRDVLRVHTDTPFDMYLRGYSASEYTGQAFMQVEENALVDAGIEIAPLQYAQYTGSHYHHYNPEPTLVTIETLRPNSRFLFTPYQLVGLEGEEEQWYADAYLISSGQESYTLATYEGRQTALISPSAEYNGFARGLYGAQRVTDEYNSVIIDGYEIQYSASANGIGIYWDGEQEIPESVFYDFYERMNSLTSLEKVEEYYPKAIEDASYLAYIIQEYTKLPDGLREQLLEWWFNIQSEKYELYSWTFDMDMEVELPYWTWLYYTAEVAGDVQASGTYTRSPGAQPRNRDFVEYFLNESNRGYCVHFASATVAVLRALGIPARYAEGYVVSESSFGEDGWATVPANKAHAWAEIWVPDFGWVPVESTPGGTAVDQGIVERPEPPAQTDTNDAASRPQTGEESEPKEEETSAPQQQSEESGESSRADSSRIGGGVRSGVAVRVPAAVFIVPGVIALLAAGVFGWRQYMRRRRRRLYHLPDANKAALHVYKQLTYLGTLGAGISDEAHATAMKARFSGGTVRRAELSALRSEAALLTRQVWPTLPWHKKLLLWLRGVDK